MLEGTDGVPADLVLIAAGFLGCEGYITDSFGVECNARTNVKTVAKAVDESMMGYKNLDR